MRVENQMGHTVQRALIVDDNVALARVTQFALDGAGFDTCTAYNGRLAMEAAQASQFDIVITDQQMPEMTGVELCQLLRSQPNYANCPIILLTAKGLELELPRLREELGINATFAKPFSPSAIVKACQELLAAPTPETECV
jgi:CheY-like chemotaxis protein